MSVLDPEPAERRHLRVVDVSMPTPRSVRVVGRGELASWPDPGAGAAVRLFLPDTPVGPVSRTYSVRDWDRERSTVTVDFALNDEPGPATQWAARVVVGMWFEVSMRRWSGFTPVVAGGPYLFAGDESAIPAIVTCVASLPSRATAVVVLDVLNSRDEQPLESHADVKIRWVLREDAEVAFDTAVLDAAARWNPRQTWIAGEAGAIRHLRRALLDGGPVATSLGTDEYWSRGMADYAESSSRLVGLRELTMQCED